MNVRIVALCLFLTICFGWTPLVQAQADAAAGGGAKAAPAKIASAPATQADLDKLRAEIGEMKTGIQELKDILNAQNTPAKAAPTSPAPKKQTGAATPPCQCGVTAAQFNAVADVARDNTKMLNKMLKRVTTSNGTKYVPNEPFWQEAIDKSLRREGTVRIQNQMTIGQWILINGRSEYIPAGTYKDIRVRAGTLTTELVGYEAPKNWTIAPPYYFQGIVIAPHYIPYWP